MLSEHEHLSTRKDHAQLEPPIGENVVINFAKFEIIGEIAGTPAAPEAATSRCTDAPHIGALDITLTSFRHPTRGPRRRDKMRRDR
jgi:hypothetical protein